MPTLIAGADQIDAAAAVVALEGPPELVQFGEKISRLAHEVLFAVNAIEVRRGPDPNVVPRFLFPVIDLAIRNSEELGEAIKSFTEEASRHLNTGLKSRSVLRRPRL
ncbi:hypothetical protein [Streptomyces sp. NPDC055912]|uniref:hypothetical protein n=1 Tax=unclassified Streptomyces TaxID=2593676 RepID=UPI0035DAED94